VNFVGFEDFSGLMRLKHLDVRIITCSLIEGRLNLPCNNSANMLTSMLSNSAYFFFRKVTFDQVCIHVLFKGSSNTLKILPSVISRGLYNAQDIIKKKG